MPAYENGVENNKVHVYTEIFQKCSLQYASSVTRVSFSLKPLQESLIGFEYVHNKQNKLRGNISCLIKICIGPGWRGG